MTSEELKLLISGDSSQGQKAVQDFGDKLQSALENPMGALKDLGSALSEGAHGLAPDDHGGRDGRVDPKQI
jgi:hypothetical protein